MKDQSSIPMESPGRRAASYWFADGLENILFGLALAVSGAAGLFWGAYVPRRWIALSWVAVYVVNLFYFSVRRRILDFFKSRITYPRTGYVQQPDEIEGLIDAGLTTLSLRPGPPPKENVTRWGWATGGVFLFFLGFVVVSFGICGSPAPRWFVPSLMGGLAATLYVVNRRSEHPYRWRSTLVLGLMGLPFLWVDVPGFVQAWSPMLLGGAWLAALGGLTLAMYLRENPYPRIAEGART